MVQKLHSSVKRWLIKAPPPMRPPYLQSGPLKRSLIGCKVHANAFVPVVSCFLLRSLFNTH